MATTPTSQPAPSFNDFLVPSTSPHVVSSPITTRFPMYHAQRGIDSPTPGSMARPTASDRLHSRVRSAEAYLPSPTAGKGFPSNRTPRLAHSHSMTTNTTPIAIVDHSAPSWEGLYAGQMGDFGDADTLELGLGIEETMTFASPTKIIPPSTPPSHSAAASPFSSPLNNAQGKRRRQLSGLGTPSGAQRVTKRIRQATLDANSAPLSPTASRRSRENSASAFTTSAPLPSRSASTSSVFLHPGTYTMDRNVSNASIMTTTSSTVLMSPALSPTVSTSFAAEQMQMIASSSLTSLPDLGGSNHASPNFSTGQSPHAVGTPQVGNTYSFVNSPEMDPGFFNQSQNEMHVQGEMTLMSNVMAAMPMNPSRASSASVASMSSYQGQGQSYRQGQNQTQNQNGLSTISEAPMHDDETTQGSVYYGESSHSQQQQQQMGSYPSQPTMEYAPQFQQISYPPVPGMQLSYPLAEQVQAPNVSAWAEQARLAVEQPQVMGNLVANQQQHQQEHMHQHQHQYQSQQVPPPPQPSFHHRSSLQSVPQAGAAGGASHQHHQAAYGYSQPIAGSSAGRHVSQSFLQYQSRQPDLSGGFVPMPLQRSVSVPHVPLQHHHQDARSMTMPHHLATGGLFASGPSTSTSTSTSTSHHMAPSSSAPIPIQSHEHGENHSYSNENDQQASGTWSQVASPESPHKSRTAQRAKPGSKPKGKGGKSRLGSSKTSPLDDEMHSSSSGSGSGSSGARRDGSGAWINPAFLAASTVSAPQPGTEEEAGPSSPTSPVKLEFGPSLTALSVQVQQPSTSTYHSGSQGIPTSNSASSTIIDQGISTQPLPIVQARQQSPQPIQQQTQPTLIIDPPRQTAPPVEQPPSGLPRNFLEQLYTPYLTLEGVHSGGAAIKRFKCLIEGCERTFPRKSAIHSHIQTHLEDKPFTCDHEGCTAAFVRQHDLRRHGRIHTGKKPHECPCGKGFARGDALVRHRQRGICSGATLPNQAQQQAASQTGLLALQGGMPMPQPIGLHSASGSRMHH